jgi:hypothetical protein
MVVKVPFVSSAKGEQCRYGLVLCKDFLFNEMIFVFLRLPYYLGVMCVLVDCVRVTCHVYLHRRSHGPGDFGL